MSNGYATETKGEEWMPIPEYEGIYEVSNLGRVRTVFGKVTSSARSDHRVWKQRILKPKHSLNRKRCDLRVSLWKDGKEKDHLVARLVASAWHGLPPDGATVNHINGDYLDNRADNLEWCSLADNITSAFETGCYSSICKRTALLNENGEQIEFRSLSKASEFLGRSDSYVGDNIRKGNLFVKSKDGTVYRIECID